MRRRSCMATSDWQVAFSLQSVCVASVFPPCRQRVFGVTSPAGESSAGLRHEYRATGAAQSQPGTAGAAPGGKDPLGLCRSTMYLRSAWKAGALAPVTPEAVGRPPDTSLRLARYNGSGPPLDGR